MRRSTWGPWRGMVWCLALVLAWGCAPKIVPKVPQEGKIDLESNIITKSRNGITISVQTEEWNFPPYDLEQFFTPFLFLIRNDTDERVKLDLAEFVLFDDQGNQYNAMPPGLVEGILTYRNLYGQMPRIFFRYEEIRPPYTLGFEFPAFVQRPLTNVTLLGLLPGEIFPHSQVRGFVYFRKATTYGKALRLRVHLDGVEETFEFVIQR